MKAPVTITLVGTKPGIPPLERLLVDVEVSNDFATPRWALIPVYVPSRAGGINKLEQLTASAGTTPVAVGRFLGTGGRYALRLAPRARITLRKLEVGWFRPDRANDIVIDVQFVDEVTLDGDPIARWFEGDPTVRGAVEVNMETARHTESHRAPSDKEVKVTITGSTPTSITLPVP